MWHVWIIHIQTMDEPPMQQSNETFHVPRPSPNEANTMSTKGQAPTTRGTVIKSPGTSYLTRRVSSSPHVANGAPGPPLQLPNVLTATLLEAKM